MTRDLQELSPEAFPINRLVRKENQHRRSTHTHTYKTTHTHTKMKRRNQWTSGIGGKAGECSVLKIKWRKCVKKRGNDQLYPMLLTGTDKELTVGVSKWEYFLLKKPSDCIPPDHHARRHYVLNIMLSFHYLMNWICFSYPKGRICSSLICGTQISSLLNTSANLQMLQYFANIPVL